jgi:hypothetical protein
MLRIDGSRIGNSFSGTGTACNEHKYEWVFIWVCAEASEIFASKQACPYAAMIAMYDRNGSSPVALARDAPVIQFS